MLTHPSFRIYVSQIWHVHSVLTQRCSHPNPQNLRSVTLSVNRDYADMIWSRPWDSPGGFSRITKVLMRGRLQSALEWFNVVKTGLAMAGFEDRSGAWSKEHKQPLEAGRRKEGFSPSVSGGRPAMLTPWFQPDETHFRFLTSGIVR